MPDGRDIVNLREASHHVYLRSAVIISYLQSSVAMDEYIGWGDPAFPGTGLSLISHLLFLYTRIAGLLPRQALGYVALSTTSIVVINRNDAVYAMGKCLGNDVPPEGLWNSCAQGAGEYWPHPTVARILVGFQISQISLGTEHVLALTTDGKLASWGSNAYGQLGVRGITPWIGYPVLWVQ